MTEMNQDLAALRAGLSETADACVPGDPGYVEAVNIWNAAITRRPSIVVRCARDSDVVAALALARRGSLEVSVRGGGHNYSGSALTEGGLMIDLTPMKSVTVDPASRRATCGGGTTWAELDAATQAHGLAVTGGFISRTGVAGLTLGGGIGWLVRPLGLSCDNVVGARVVTADGQILTASADEHPDLFWALRGGGGNFGVVTRFEYRLHEVGPLVNLGLFFWGLDQGVDALRFSRDFLPTLPESTGSLIAALNAPPAPFVPPQYHFARATRCWWLASARPRSTLAWSRRSVKRCRRCLSW